MTDGLHRERPPGARKPAATGTVRGNLLRLQRAAGNRAVTKLIAGRKPAGGLPVVQRADDDITASLESRAQENIEAAKAKAAARQAGAGDQADPGMPSPSADQEPPSPNAEQVAAERAKQRQDLGGAVAPPDTAGAQSEAQTAGATAKAEAMQPPTPVVPERAAPAPADGGSGGTAAGAVEAEAASKMANEAASLAATEAPPPMPAMVEIPEPLQVINGGGREIPANPALEARVASVGARLQGLRSGSQQVRQAASAERAQGHRMDTLIQTGLSGVAEAGAGISTLKEHSTQRRIAVGQAKAALEVSKQKAETVASGAPTVSAKSDEGAEKSGPMAEGAKDLASQNASHVPDDAEAAGKSGEQGAKLSQASSDAATIDSTIGQTKERAGQLAAEAEEAKQKNSVTEGTIAQTEQAVSQTEAKTAEMAGQNEAARAQLDGFAAQPAAHRAAADALDAQGETLHAASVALEARLATAQQSYLDGMAAMPPPVPRRGGPSVQREGYEGRTEYNPAGAVAAAVPSWLSGEDPPSAQTAADYRAKQEANRAAEFAEIDREAGGHFDQLSASQKAGLALSMAGRNLLSGIGETNFPRFGLTILRGFVDPRVTLMGVVQGFGKIASGVANLLSAEQWSKDPLGNALKSSADIATGVAIVLGSIAGLAVAIGIILTAIAIVGSIFSFGAVGAALLPIIIFCGTVAETVGPWALWAAGIALVLHALVFIKNLIDAATASTATELQTKSDQMTEDAQNAGSMALQLGMAKAMEAGGKLLSGGGTGGAEPGGGAPVEGGPPAAETPTPATTETPAPTGEPPGPGAETPAPAAQAPRPTAETPAPTTEPPAPAAEAPAPTTEPPAPAAEESAPAAEAPSPDTEGPEEFDPKQAEILQDIEEAQQQGIRDPNAVDGEPAIDGSEAEEPGRIPELDQGESEHAFGPEGKWRLPAEWRGSWDGPPGESRWTPNDPAAYGLEEGQSIPFRDGVPDLTEFTVDTPAGQPGTIDVEGLTGDNRADFDLADEQLAAEAGMEPDEVAEWRRDNGLTYHHYSRTELQLVPQRIHAPLAHQGSASALR